MATPISQANSQSGYRSKLPTERLPDWISSSIGKASELEKVQNLIKGFKVHTICEEGRCPNRGECYAAGTATFLLGGSICTRSCAFCQVEKGNPKSAIDKFEATNIAEVVNQLQLRYVVLTSVARDDLEDHGASLFTSTMAAIRVLNPNVSIEVLTPDFWGGVVDTKKAKQIQKERLTTVLKSNPVCFNHNLETVERLQKEVRRGAKYYRSLDLLKTANEVSPNIPTKSGLMLGLGESHEEIVKTLKDLRSANCQIITLGQYLRPSLNHLPVQRYWHPEEFEALASIAKEMGFSKVKSGPLVRSSYHAEKS